MIVGDSLILFKFVWRQVESAFFVRRLRLSHFLFARCEIILTKERKECHEKTAFIISCNHTHTFPLRYLPRTERQGENFILLHSD